MVVSLITNGYVIKSSLHTTDICRRIRRIHTYIYIYMCVRTTVCWTVYSRIHLHPPHIWVGSWFILVGIVGRAEG